MRAKPFLIALIGTIVLVIAVSLYVSITVERPRKVIIAVAAPDGKYKAVRASITTGGAAPFCFDTIAVFLSVYPDSFVESEKAYEVYGAPCAAPDKRAALPKIEWLSNFDVKITYAPAPDAAVKPRLKALDASRFVHVTFVRE